ncbi:cyclase family protein [Actinomadura rubrisoli]|uniref:Cyclase family protein n=1 Tax=Actinomadura rubrisoli TaxID=2530368 RepID=A0A4R5AKN6_9ACTN|nr:cyclase family protein [Actinomadura rubrisoli]TDD73458.1 cyclase family protein [Actinomadura rubrisoli]
MRVIDLSTTIDAERWEPDELSHKAMSAKEGAVHMTAAMREHLGLELDPDELPDGEFLTNDFLSLSTHMGTHVDAPSHYGSRPTYTDRPRDIDQLPLDWFLRPGFVLDLTDVGTGTAGVAHLEKELQRIGYRPRPFDICLLHTGAEARIGTPGYFTDFTGLDGPATHFLLDLGIKVIGTDAFSLDAPFPYIIKTYRETGDRGVLWPSHFAGRDREYCQIERLGGLGALPEPFGFRVACFPTKIARAGAGWTRAVALLDR